MLSLFNTLNMAAQSLSVQQEATAVAGQNLANVNNPAYSRQQLVIQAAAPLQTTIGQEGTGVESTGISQARNSLLDTQIQAEGSVSGSLNAQQTALQNMETSLDEQLSTASSSSDGAASSANGLTADLSTFFGSLQTLSTNPSNLSDRQAVVQAAQQLTQQFNTVSAGAATVTSNLNSSIQSAVTSSNQDLSQIATLNQQIIDAQNSGGSANDLVDTREQLLENLAGNVNISTTADADGAIDVSIGGVTMVSGGATPDSLATYTNSSGNLMVQAATAGTPLTLSGGSIEGNITARDGAVSALSSSINTLATQLITQVNSVYSAGYDLNGNTGANFFTGTDAGSIGVSSTVANDPTTFQASGTAGAAGDNTVALGLANLATQSISALNNQTITQSYSETIGSFGSSLQSVNEQLANSSSVTEMLTSQRDSVSGVDTDTEMTNLMQFQKAYEASAEMITTVNEMLETLISMKTE